MVVVSLAILLAGCGNTRDTIGLIQTPAFSNGEQGEINKALNELLPPGAEFVTSKKAEPKQSIFIDDLNQDSKKEAFVLYRDIKENQQVHLMILQEVNGKWNELSDLGTNFNTLDYFKLEDLDGDGNKEVVLGVSTSDSEQKKQLFIYEFDGKGLVKKVEHTYEWIDIEDYNKDQKPDILILNGDVNKSQTSEIFSYEKGQLQSRSILKLNPDGFHENIVSGKLADGKKALFIDSGLGAHSMLTEIVAYENGKLIKLGNGNDSVLFKAYPLYSRDINKDGIIEVGGMYIPKGFEDAAMAEIPFIYTYNDYRTDGTKQIIEERYTDSGQHFYITIPSKWYGKVTIKKLDKGVRLVSNEDQKILFEVKWINKNSSVTINKKLKETKDTIFYTDMKEKQSIPDDYLSKPFSIVELEARIISLMRRMDYEVLKKDRSILKSGPFELDMKNKKISCRGRDIKVTPTEYCLLQFLISNKNKVFTRDNLLDEVWGANYVRDLKVVDVNIRRIRRKVEFDPSNPKFLCTEWGYGYLWRE